MATKKKHLIRVVFDVLDGMKHQIRLNEDLFVATADPDEAIEWVLAEMQRQYSGRISTSRGSALVRKRSQLLGSFLRFRV